MNAPTTVYNFMPLVLLMAKAKQSIKFPTVVLETPIGQLKLSICGQRSRNAGGVNITDGKPYGEHKWYGVVQPNIGMFRASELCSQSEIDMVKRCLDKFQIDPAAYAGIIGRETGHCCFCRRELTNDGSLEVGYGPDCASNYGLPHSYKHPERRHHQVPIDPNKDLRNSAKHHFILDQLNFQLEDGQ